MNRAVVHGNDDVGDEGDFNFYDPFGKYHFHKKYANDKYLPTTQVDAQSQYAPSARSGMNYFSIFNNM